MKRRTFITGSIAAAVSAALPGSALAPTIEFIPPAISVERWAQTHRMMDFEAAETVAARVKASMFISGKLLDPLEIADRVRLSLAAVDRVCSVVRSECVDGGFKITVSEDPE